MYPTFVQLGGLSISTYGITLAVAFLVAVGLASHATRRSLKGLVPLTAAEIPDLACWILVGGLVGGRLFYVVDQWGIYRFDPGAILAVWRGGLVWYGGLAGGLAAAWLYLHKHGHPFLRTADQVVPFFLGLAHAIGRVGCYANGCCYGVRTSAWYGVRFPGHAHAVIPTQLFEAAGLLILFLVLRGLQVPRVLKRPGTLFGVYLIGYGMLRWGLEFWRAHQPIVWVGWTVHQFISVVLVGLGLLLVVAPLRSVPKR